MNTMRFSEKQENVSIYELESGARDVVILANEREVVETDPFEDSKAKESTAYEYDGNIFRTHLLTSEQIKADPDGYLNYEGDEAPTDVMIEYANLKIDEYTEQLIEEGLI